MNEKRNCDQCGNEYEPQYYDVLGSHILVGQGNCPVCNQKEYDAEVAKENAALQASIMATRRKRRQECGIPSKFMNQDFSTFEKGWQDEAYKKCWNYAGSFPVDHRPTGYPSLYLWASGNKENPSGNGTGKSHLSYAIVHRILDRWTGENDRGCLRVICLREQDLFRQIQATYSFTPEEKMMRESEDDIIKSIIYADLVVIDDVGKEVRANSDFVRKILFAIINGRYDQNLPLIITANLAPAQLKVHLDKPPTEASYSRFLEMTKRQSVVMDGRSYRRK